MVTPTPSIQVIFTIWTVTRSKSSVDTNWRYIGESVWTSLCLCIYCPVLASAVVLGLVGPIPSLLGDSKSNVLNIHIRCIVFSYTPSISQNFATFQLFMFQTQLNLFLQFWELLQWFLLYSILHLQLFIFPELKLFILSNFYFFLHITIQSPWLPAPNRANLFHRLLPSSLPGFLSFFFSPPELGQMCPQSYTFCFVLFCFPSPFWRCAPPDIS